MISQYELKQSGYHLFVDNSKRKNEFTPEEDAYKGTWQKCIRDNKGQKFFVNIDHWDFANSRFAYKNKNDGPTFEAHSQLRSTEGTFNVTLLSCQHKTISEVEWWIEKQWIGNGCEYYEKND